MAHVEHQIFPISDPPVRPARHPMNPARRRSARQDRRGTWLLSPIAWLTQRPSLDRAAEILSGLTSNRDGRVMAELRGQSLGHPVHPALTDAPIGFWTSATVLDLFGGAAAARSAQALVGWGTLSALPAVITGVAELPRQSTRRRRVGVVHAASMGAAVVGYGGSWWLRRRSGHHRVAIGVGLLAGTIASAGGYLGGWLSLGRDGRTEHDDENRHARRIADGLAGRRVVTAESCTAGRVATELITVRGAAAFVSGSVVAYQTSVKQNLLGVHTGSVYTTEAAIEMARGACELFGAECAVATTGVAGECAVDGVAPGTVFIATSVDGTVNASEYAFRGDAWEITEQATEQALIDLAHALQEAPTPQTTSEGS